MTTRNKYSSRNKFEKPFIRKACLLCKIDFLDYKNIGLLKKYISDRGKLNLQEELVHVQNVSVI